MAKIINVNIISTILNNYLKTIPEDSEISKNKLFDNYEKM